jgi:hypothetical protein
MFSYGEASLDRKVERSIASGNLGFHTIKGLIQSAQASFYAGLFGITL